MTARPAEQTTAASRLAEAARRAAELRAWIEQNGLRERIARAAADAPPLAPAQRDRLALLLGGGAK